MGYTTEKNNQNQTNVIRRVIGWLPELARYSCCIYLCIAVVLCTTTICLYGHALIRDFAKYNWLFFLVALVICIGIVLITAWRTSKKSKALTSEDKTHETLNHFNRVIVICAIVLFVLQMILFFGMFFVSGWDVAKIMFKFGDEQYYFNMYPNNIFMHGLALKLASLIRTIGFDTFISNVFSQVYPGIIQKINEYGSSHPDYLSYAIGYAIFSFIGIIGTNLSVVMITLVIRKKSNDKFSIFAFVIAAFFIGLSPWILVPYSDIYALIFVTLILWAYICIKNQTNKCIVITVATVIGFNIKPTICFCLIAILFVEFCKWIQLKCSFKNIKKLVKPVVAITLSGMLSLCVVAYIKQLDFQPDKEMQMTSTHFLMMGLNPDTDGFFNEPDVTLSQSYDNIEEREYANVQEITNRLSKMGPLGLAKLFANKTMINFGDPTFQWAFDGGQDFYLFKVGNVKIIQWLVDNSYPIKAIIWFALIVGSILCAFIKSDKSINVMTTTLIILAMFLMVFESGSRYLVLYTPFFVIIGLLGWRNLQHKCVLKFNKAANIKNG